MSNQKKDFPSNTFSDTDYIMASNDSIGPEQFQNMLGAPRKRSAEDILQRLASSGTGKTPPGGGRPQPHGRNPSHQPQPDAAAQHDSAIRNHLAGLVRVLLQSGDMKKLRELLTEHRSFIDGILVILDGKEGQNRP